MPYLSFWICHPSCRSSAVRLGSGGALYPRGLASPYKHPDHGAGLAPAGHWKQEEGEAEEGRDVVFPCIYLALAVSHWKKIASAARLNLLSDLKNKPVQWVHAAAVLERNTYIVSIRTWIITMVHLQQLPIKDNHHVLKAAQILKLCTWFSLFFSYNLTCVIKCTHL